MAEGLLLGLDVGTTAVKAGAFDARSGRPLAWATREVPIDSRADGTRELTAARLLSAVRRCIRAVAQETGDRWRGLAGVGLAAQGGSACLMDRNTGQARTPMQLWNDSRPLALLADIAARRPGEYWRKLAFLDEPGAGLARVTWLRRRHRRAWDANVLYGGAGEYLYFQLTGQWRQDAGNALQIGCYDARARDIAPEPLSLVDAEPRDVAPMRISHQTHPLSPAGAKLLGCRPGIPVAGPYMDHEAGFLSAAASAGPDVLQCSLGTAWVGNFLCRRLPPPAGGFNLVLPAPTGRGSLVIRVLPAGNATLDWAFDAFAGGRGSAARKRAEAMLAERLLPPAGLVGLPWLTRPNPFASGGDRGTGGSGGVLGCDPHTTREDLLRTMVSGLCFAFRHVLDPVVAAGRVRSVLLTGGASRSQPVRTLLAGLLAPLPVRVCEQDELAGAGGSVWTLNASAARRPCKLVRPPRRAQLNRIADAYGQFVRTCTALAGGLGESAGVQLAYYRRSSRS